MKAIKSLKRGTVKVILSVITLVAMLAASSACLFLVLHDGGNEVNLPRHLQK